MVGIFDGYPFTNVSINFVFSKPYLYKFSFLVCTFQKSNINYTSSDFLNFKYSAKILNNKTYIIITKKNTKSNENDNDL